MPRPQKWPKKTNMKKFNRLKEDLRQWFDPNHPKGGWKRINSKGEAIGPCAREPGEAKPKCMSNEKRAALSKKERASAVRTKRKHDPDAERKGKPINVSNFGKGKLSENMEQLDEKNVPTSPEKWAQAKSQAKAKFDVYPCVPLDSLAISKNGPISHDELDIGDEILTYNMNQDILEWKPIIDKHYYEDAPLLEIGKPTGFSIRCTPNHKWVISKDSGNELVETKDLNTHMRILMCSTLKNDSSLLIENWSKKDNWVEKILSMNEKEREIFLASSVVYDGWDKGVSSKIKDRHTFGFCQKEYDHLWASLLAAYLNGYYVNSREKSEDMTSANYIRNKRYHNTQNLYKKDAGSEDVWCPTTENETWVMIQNGLITITGNSAYANGWAAKKYKEMGGGWKSVSEAVKDKYDEGEYDQEGDMAKSDLRSIIANAKRLHDMLDDADNLPEWVQSKITKAEDYISTVANYMAAEMSEETKLQESGGSVVYKKGDDHIEKYGEDSFALYKDGKKAKYYTSIAAAKEAMNEESELIEAIYSIKNTKTGQVYKMSKYPINSNNETLKKIHSAGGDHVHATPHKDGKPIQEKVELDESEDIRSHRVGDEVVLKNKNYSGTIVKSKGSDISFKNKSDGKHYKATHGMIDRNLSQENRYKERSAVKNKKFDDAIASDMKRIDKSGALKKFGIGVKKEEVEQIDEVSPSTLGSYVKRASQDAVTKAMKYASKRDESGKESGTLKKISNRESGIRKATDRLTKEEIEQLEEGRPSQSHPLEGHEYHKKSNAELEYIAKDAHKAAEAMKSHNTTAENKYRDQANDSATVRHFRKTSGTPNWYKKKYGINEENKPPFDGPYTKVTGTVTDKSGAKHSSMSRVRDIARKAMKKQADKMKPASVVKESLQESKKADIVKNAMKSAKEKAMKTKDTFEADPVLSSEVMKENR